MTRSRPATGSRERSRTAPRHRTRASAGRDQAGDQQYGEQYGQPQPWSTGSTAAGAAPDPQQAYDRPPLPADDPYRVEEPRRTDEPGTAQLPRITEDTPPRDDERR